MKKIVVPLFLVVLFFMPGCGEPLPDDVKALVGVEYVYPRSMEIIEKYGSPDTLTGTDGEVWVAYFPKGDFTIISKKGKDSRILTVLRGKRPQ